MVAETVAIADYIVTLTSATGLFERQAQVLAKALRSIDDVYATAYYTPEHKGELAATLEAKALAAAAELFSSWQQTLSEHEATARQQAAANAAQRGDLHQLAKANGLALLEVFAGHGDADALLAEFEEVQRRAIPGEVEAWATALPFKLEDLWRGDPNKRVGLPAVRSRCAAVLESLLTPTQREAIARLAFFAQERKRAELVESLGGGQLNSVRHRLARLTRELGLD
jgi:hypothetical protein